MINSESYDGGNVDQAIENIDQNLHPNVQRMFHVILDRIKSYTETSNLYLSAPSSEQWITVKKSPRKAVIAFRNDNLGNLKFDIDTYADNDITDNKGLLELIPDPEKPNKRHVAHVTPKTSDNDLEYFISKMLEGMRKLDR